MNTQRNASTLKDEGEGEGLAAWKLIGHSTSAVDSGVHGAKNR